MHDVFKSVGESGVATAKLNLILLKLMQVHNVQAVGYSILNNFSISNSSTLSINESIRATDESIFQACSLSKSLTAFAVLHLVEQGKIQLDASLNAQLKSWKIEGQNAGSITVRHALAMTSGLGYGDVGSSFPGYLQSDPVPALADILLGQQPATNPAIQSNFIPGSTYYYSGAGYMAIQQLIEDVVGVPFRVYMADVILPQLRMNNSTFSCPLSDINKSYAIPGFNRDNQPLANGWENIVGAASGGLWTTPSDVSKFMLSLSDSFGNKEGILSFDSIKEMFTKNLNTNFGLGVVVDDETNYLNIRKNGHNAGYHCELLLFPETGNGVVIMTNSVNGLALISEFIKVIADTFNWPEYSKEFNELL